MNFNQKRIIMRINENVYDKCPQRVQDSKAKRKVLINCLRDSMSYAIQNGYDKCRHKSQDVTCEV